MNSTMERKFDVIIFGASGYTGEFVVEEMARNAPQEGLKWAVAGRNRHKVQQSLTEVQKRLSDDLKDIKIFEADVTDQTSLELMCENARLLVNCVGPYGKYGEPVAAACIKQGTHMVDMSAEISFINDIMIKKYHEAETQGVYIVSACGQAFLFFEMAIPVLQEKFEGGIDEIDLYINPIFKRRSVHSATWESYVNTSKGIYEILVARQRIYSEIMKITRSKCSILSLSCPVKCCKEIKGLSFCYPSVLHTAELGLDMREDSSNEKSVKVTYYWVIDSMVMLIMYAVVVFFLICLYPFSVGKRLLTKCPGLFSCGLVKKSTLIEETEDTSILNFTAVAKGWSQKQNHKSAATGNPDKTVVLHGSGPPIYKNSSICVVQAALTILQEADRLPARGGIYTSLAAFSKTSLPSRLQENGIIYKEKRKELIL